MRKLSNLIKHKYPSGLASTSAINDGYKVHDKYLTTNWWNPNVGMRVFCDPINGYDSNDGSTWSKAVKTLQKAVDIIPTVLSIYSAIIVPAGTTIVGANISKLQVSGNDVNDSWIPLDIIAVCDGNTDNYFTNNGERNSFGNTPLIMDTSTTMLNFSIGHSNHGIFAVGADNKDAWGMFKLTPLTDEGNYNGIFGTSRFVGAVQFRGCIFDDGAKNRGHNYSSWGYMPMFSFTDCQFSAPSLNTGTGKWSGVFRFGEGSQQINFVTGGSYDPAYPKPFTEAVKIINYTQFLSFGYDKYLGFNTVYVESINIDSTSGKLDIYIQEDNKAVVTIKDVSTNYNITGTNKGVDILFNDVKIVPPFPTSDPAIVGALWNDAGIVKHSGTVGTPIPFHNYPDDVATIPADEVNSLAHVTSSSPTASITLPDGVPEGSFIQLYNQNISYSIMVNGSVYDTLGYTLASKKSVLFVFLNNEWHPQVF